MKLAVPDMISNSYFPAIAAIELGFFKREGPRRLARADLSGRQMPMRRCATARSISSAARRIRRSRRSRNGRAPSSCARRRRACTGSWSCTRDLGAQARRSRRGERPQHRRRALGRYGLAPAADRRRASTSSATASRSRRCPGAVGAGVNFGVTAAKALEDRKIDGFWANGMGAEVAVRRGIGTRRARRAPRRRAEAAASTTLWRRSRRPMRLIAALAGGGRRRGPRDREDACGAEGGCRARPQVGQQAVSAVGGRADRRAHPPRPALLRRVDLARRSSPA